MIRSPKTNIGITIMIRSPKRAVSWASIFNRQTPSSRTQKVLHPSKPQSYDLSLNSKQIWEFPNIGGP